MKSYLSVFMLMCRRLLPKAFVIMLLVSAAQCGAFFVSRGQYAPGFGYALARVYDSARCELIAGAGLVLLSVLMASVGCDRAGSRQENVLNRLAVSPRAVLVMQALANAVLLLVYLFLQLGTAAALLRSALDGVAEYGRDQALMLAFYRSDYLHSLLPLADWTRVMRVVALILGLASALACYPARQRSGSRPVAGIAALCLVLLFFSGRLYQEGTDFAVALAGLVTAAAPVLMLWGDENAKAAL